MSSEDYIDLYLNGKLSKEEIAVFEKKIEIDPEFAEEVKLRRLAKRADYIDLYINGKLAKEETIEFEKKMKGDPDLSIKVNVQRFDKMAILGEIKQNNIKYFEELGHKLLQEEAFLTKEVEKSRLEGMLRQLQSALKDIQKKVFSHEPSLSRRVAVFMLPIAAVIVVFILLKMDNFFPDSQPKAFGENPREAFAMLISKDPPVLNVNELRNSGEIDTTLQDTEDASLEDIKLYKQASVAYNQKNYKEAQELLLSIQSDKIIENTKFHLAFTYLELGDYSEARRIFENYDTKNPDSDQYRWYLILTLLALEDEVALKKELCDYISEEKIVYNKDVSKELRHSLGINCAD